jgi:hypothetical protein
VKLKNAIAPARSALRRIVKKLTTALTEVVRSSHGRKGQAINYETLAALSNGSSSDAIRTMTDLSSRVGSASAVSRGRQRSRRHNHKLVTKSERHSQGKSKKRDKTRSSKPASHRGRPTVDRHHRQDRKGRHSPELLATHRISILTTSSDSTKLGEIRHRLSKPRPTEEFGNKVAYPLYAYHTEEVPVRKKWWNPFRRR